MKCKLPITIVSIIFAVDRPILSSIKEIENNNEGRKIRY